MRVNLAPNLARPLRMGPRPEEDMVSMPQTVGGTLLHRGS